MHNLISVQSYTRNTQEKKGSVYVTDIIKGTKVILLNYENHVLAKNFIRKRRGGTAKSRINTELL